MNNLKDRGKLVTAEALCGNHLNNCAAKHVIVVDDHVFDWEAMERARCCGLNAGMGDISTLPKPSGSMLDPIVPIEEKNPVKYQHGGWTPVLIEATVNWKSEPQQQHGGNRYPSPGTAISPKMAMRLKERWSEYDK